jgi:hypothetical protein
VHYLKVQWFYKKEDIDTVKPKHIKELDRSSLTKFFTACTLMFLNLIRYLESSAEQELYVSNHYEIIESSEIASE